MKSGNNHFLLLGLLFIYSSVLVSCGTGNNPSVVEPGKSIGAVSEKVGSGLQSSTGFYWPTDKGDPKDYNNWLAASCSWSKSKTYQLDFYHIGMDIIGVEKERVYAIADGTVIRVSRNDMNNPKTKTSVEKGGDPAGWGIGNIAILVDHQLADGSHFVAVYGHIKDDLDNRIHTGENKTIRAHDVLGLMGPYPLSKPHLHLGIYPIQPQGRVDAPSPLGRMNCPSQEPIKDTNGFTSPYTWLITQYPGSSPSARPTQLETKLKQGKIVYISAENDAHQIDTIMADGTLKNRISNGLEYFSPAWSPDGSQIAFYVHKDSNDPGEIYVFQADGTNLTRIVDLEEMCCGGHSLGLDWSPDGKWIAFTGPDSIYQISAQGQGLEKLVDAKTPGSISWSPDGKTILFEAVKPNTNFNEWVFLFDIATGKVDQLIGNGNHRFGEPSWSPDNSKIAYISDENGTSQIYVVNADGSGKQQITNNSGGAFKPKWISPQIIIFEKMGEKAGVYWVSIGSQDIHLLLNSSVYDLGGSFDYSPFD